MPSQRGHMPPVTREGRLLASSSCRRCSTVIAPRAADRGDVEGERLGRADVRLAEPAEEDAQHRVGVGGGADGGAGVGAHPLLVDDDRGRQPVEHVDLRPRQRRHEALHERAVGLVDQPLRLRGDRAEHQRALARAGDAGEHRQPALRDLDADVLEVVHARALHADQIVAVGARAAQATACPSSWPCSVLRHRAAAAAARRCARSRSSRLPRRRTASSCRAARSSRSASSASASSARRDPRTRASAGGSGTSARGARAASTSRNSPSTTPKAVRNR